MAAVIIIAMIVLFFALLRGVYLLFQPGDHSGNIALRKARWRMSHPDARRTPWDK